MGAHIRILLTFLLVAGSAAATSKTDVFHVAGSVLCQDCSQGYAEWVNGANPIQGCKVSVMCLDDRSRVVHYASDLTDEAGNFDISCNKYVNGKKLKPELCTVRLVSSPDPVCNVATNFAGGKTGINLRRPTVVYRDLLKYVMGSFYYTTPMCDEPQQDAADTTGSGTTPSPYKNDQDVDADADADADANDNNY